MTDEELVKQWDEYVESMGSVMGAVEHMAQQMRDRIKSLAVERDRAYTSGYSDAETEISKSALGQSNSFLHSRYADAKLRIEALTAERDRQYDENAHRIAMQAKAEAERDRLQQALTTAAGRLAWVADTSTDPFVKRLMLKEWADETRAELEGETP